MTTRMNEFRHVPRAPKADKYLFNLPSVAKKYINKKNQNKTLS